MNVAIIDADLVTRNRHRFPNLACLKLSGYWKEKGATVQLKTDYDALDQFDKVYVSKVFTDTPIDESILQLENVEYGGTGFFFDQAPDLPYEIEHHMPDYHLYDEFVYQRIDDGSDRKEFKEYLDYSIGYVTRGCFRKCGFCVNRKYDRAFVASSLDEFLDPERPKICLLDDNFFSHPKWREILKELEATGKPFKFKQGLDERLLTDEKTELLCQTKYDGAITFAFDRISDYRMVEKKLILLRKYTDKQFSFYVLVGFESQDEHDIENAFKRIELLMKYRCLPYIMRFADYEKSEWKQIYINLASWCNQPRFLKKVSFREYIELKQAERKDQTVIWKAKKTLMDFEAKYPEIAQRWFDMKWCDVC